MPASPSRVSAEPMQANLCDGSEEVACEGGCGPVVEATEGHHAAHAAHPAARSRVPQPVHTQALKWSCTAAMLQRM